VILDLRTMYVVTAITFLVLGSMQLATYFVYRFERWPVWWGLSNLLVGLGTLGVALREVLPGFVSIQLSNIVTAFGYLLLLISVREFSGHRGFQWSYGLSMAATVVLFAFVWNDPATYRERVAFGSALFCWFDIMVVREGICMARRDGLASGWLLAGIFSLTAILFGARTLMAMTGHIGGASLFSAVQTPYQWMAVTAEAFVTVRGFALFALAAERSHKLVLANARRDPLTGTLNRSGLQLAFARLAVLRTPVRVSDVSVLVVDLDHFKAVNDTHGHTAGDDVLRTFASVALNELRSIDTLARQGGDEFVILLPRTGLDDAVMVAQRIRKAFSERSASIAGLQVRPTLSIGVAAGDAATEGLDAMLHRADVALYRSKRDGRDRVSGAGPATATS
jgi:diguanylate cyclase (GGDEF)-like protein